jgi:two-component system chemotaxis response regulator CheY
MTRLMLVEDDAAMRSLLKTIFELEGFEVITQQGSGEAVIRESILNEKPDILLLDVNLHNANGIEITKYLRENYSAEMKIILSSGMPLRFDCLKAGANDFLLKPFMPDELIEKVKQFI